MLNSPRVMDDSAAETDDFAREGDPPQPTPAQRAQTMCELGRFAAAAEAAGRAIADEPRNAHAWCLMAEAQLGQDRPPAALVAAQAACRLEPDAEASHRMVSLALGALGRDEEAAAAAGQATRHAPQSWRAHARLAQCLAALCDRLPEARQAAQRALELEPGQAGPHLAIGRVALAAGRETDATSAFCAALGVDPLCVEAHIELSTLLSRERRSPRPWARVGLFWPRRRGRADGAWT
ncbi:MAG: tetratricopeptide repeat protein [Solirubrobacteraceae bacterium]